MSGVVLFEQSHRGEVWRLEVSDHDARVFLNWRKWWWQDDTLKPTRQGVTIPLGRMRELYEAIGTYLVSAETSGPNNGA